MKLPRRQFLLQSAALASVPSLAFAEANDYADSVRAFAGAKRPIKKRVLVSVPPLVENGGQVPAHIVIDHEMTDKRYIRRVLVLVEDNPQSKVGLFAFTPDSGRAEMTFRLRMAKSSRIVVLAENNKGAVFEGSAVVRVVEGACGPVVEDKK